MSELPRFVHLHLHTEYSLLEGAIRVSELPGLCVKHEMPAVAVTDTNNMFGALEFSVRLAEKGIQPIHGCQMFLEFATGGVRKDPQDRFAPIILLAQNEVGYGNLIKLNSCMYLRDGVEAPHITISELDHHADGIICLTGGTDGPIVRLLHAGQVDAAKRLLENLGRVFSGPSLRRSSAPFGGRKRRWSVRMRD